MTFSIGRPPSIPETIVLAPNPIKSLFKFVFLLKGSSLSIALAAARLIIEEIIVIDKTTSQKTPLFMREKSGNKKTSVKSDGMDIR